MKKQYPYRSKQWFHWHGRVGHPLIHLDLKTGETYVMVRAKGGGTKRLYDYQKYLRNSRAVYYKKNGKLYRYKQMK